MILQSSTRFGFLAAFYRFCLTGESFCAAFSHRQGIWDSFDFLHCFFFVWFSGLFGHISHLFRRDLGGGNVKCAHLRNVDASDSVRMSHISAALEGARRRSFAAPRSMCRSRLSK